MSEGKRKSIVFVILIITVIWGAWNLYPTASDQTEYPRTDKHSESASSEATTSADYSASIRTDHDSICWQKDPFARGRFSGGRMVAQEERASLELTAISVGGRSPMAVIDGRVLGIGDHVDGWLVTDISGTAVILTKGTGRTILSLGGNTE